MILKIKISLKNFMEYYLEYRERKLIEKRLAEVWLFVELVGCGERWFAHVLPVCASKGVFTNLLEFFSEPFRMASSPVAFYHQLFGLCVLLAELCPPRYR